MPPKLPCKDVWAVYRTAVLGYDLTNDRKDDILSMLFTTIRERSLTAKELLFWHNRAREL